MSAIARPSVGSGVGASAGGVVPPRGAVFRVRWALSRAALAACRAGTAITGPDAVLEWRVGRGQAVAVLIDGPAMTEVFRSGAGDVVEHRVMDELTHVRVERCGVCVFAAVFGAVFGGGASGEDMLYARTVLLTQMGLPGGRYGVAAGGPAQDGHV